MTGSIIWLIAVFAFGLIFYRIGAHAEKRKQPMWFITGTPLSAERVRDVKEFNRENARMWKNFSLPYFGAGIVHFYDERIAIVVLVLASTAGIAWLFWTYKKIRAKYECEPPKTYPKKKKKK